MDYKQKIILILVKIRRIMIMNVVNINFYHCRAKIKLMLVRLFYIFEILQGKHALLVHQSKKTKICPNINVIFNSI